jgi:hypothetical protein
MVYTDEYDIFPLFLSNGLRTATLFTNTVLCTELVSLKQNLLSVFHKTWVFFLLNDFVIIKVTSAQEKSQYYLKERVWTKLVLSIQWVRKV